VGLAEDLAQDALVAALEQWPNDGIPRNPGAWLMTAAKHRAIDRLRRNSLLARKHAQLKYELERQQASPVATAEAADGYRDDLLRLIFIACHPILALEARVALTLRLLGGLTTSEIARAFLVTEPTMAQRIVRAKRTLARAKVPFEVPQGADRDARLASVLDVLYLIFNEGYAASGGADLIRPALCDEALRLGRILAELAPAEPEVHGLVALMELQASRQRARIGAAGEPVLLADQNRALWDRLLIGRGLKALARSQALGRPAGPYGLQAAIAACHATAMSVAETDWARVAAIYADLAVVAPSPIVDLNHAVAVGMAEGPQAGLARLEKIHGHEALAAYPYLPAARADMLEKLGRFDEAAFEFGRAAALAANQRTRALLEARAARCEGAGSRTRERDAAGPE
jgi:RNA polymerase sigma factor (sigma-70 family)